MAADKVTRDAAAVMAAAPPEGRAPGKDCRRLAAISRLPAPLLDALRRRVFRLRAPGSLAR